MFEYGRPHRSGELLHATDEFRGARTAANVTDNMDRSHIGEYILGDQ